MSAIRTLFGFSISYLLMFIGARIPIVGPFIIGAIGTLIARCGPTAGFFLGFTSYLLYVTTILAIATLYGEATIDTWLFSYTFGSLSALIAGVGGYFAGRVFEKKPYYYYYR